MNDAFPLGTFHTIEVRVPARRGAGLRWSSTADPKAGATVRPVPSAWTR